MRNILLFLLLFISSMVFSQDRKQHLIVTHLHQEFIGHNFAVLNNNRQVVDMVKKIGGHITFLTNGDPILVNFSDHYQNESFKETWSGEFGDVANKYYSDSLDDVNITVIGVYFQSCEKNAIFSAIADLAEARVNKITVHIPMPTTMLNDDYNGDLIHFGHVSDWTRKEVVVAIKNYYNDLDKQIHLIKTATKRNTNTRPYSDDAISRMLAGQDYVYTVKTRNPSQIKNYDVKLFVDGYEYLPKTDVLTTNTWTDIADEKSTINIIFWSFLDKYFDEVLNIKSTEPIVHPIHRKELPKITPYVQYILDKYCSGATSITDTSCFHGITSISDNEYLLVNNILIGKKDNYDNYVLACRDDINYLDKQQPDELIKNSSDYIYDIGLKTSCLSLVVKVKKEYQQGINFVYAIDNDGEKLFYHQPIGYCEGNSFFSYLSTY
ncbi:MAG: hypothetical protein WCQ47_03700 [bacterium]